MDSKDVHKFLHAINNQINAATLNAFLLRKLHAESLDETAMESLDAALRDADKVIKDFQRRLASEPFTATSESGA